MIRAAASRLSPTSLFRPREVTDLSGAVYLRRWRLVRCRGFSVALHHILRSDYAPEPHDHPWSYVSVILAGGYWERVGGDASRWRGAGSVAVRPAGTPHRIDIPDGRPAWTLMLRGRWRRSWGFHTRCGWRPWKEYVEKLRKGLPICED